MALRGDGGHRRHVGDSAASRCGHDSLERDHGVGAAGLAFFAIAGTEKALLFNLHPFIAVLMGTITGVGGGTIRDLGACAPGGCICNGCAGREGRW